MDNHVTIIEEENPDQRHVIFDSHMPKRHRHHHHQHRHPIYLTSTPDGGWGWVVIFSTFIVFVLTLGFKTSFGVFYVEWERYFDVTKTQVSWVTSMSPLVIGIVSPFSAGICHAIGPRPPIIFGGIVAAAGLLGSSYSQTIFHLMISIGIVSATGMGFAFAPSIIVLHHYFEKRFVVANGVAFAGVSCGELVFPLVLQPMIHEYGWQGALFIMSAVVLNLTVCGGVMIRPQARVPNTPASCKGSNNDFAESQIKTMDKAQHRRASTQSGISCISSVSSESSMYSLSDLQRPRFLSEPRKTIALFMFGESEKQHDWKTDGEQAISRSRHFQDKSNEHTNVQSRKRGGSVLSTYSLKIINEIKHERFRLRRPLQYPFFVVMLPIMILHGAGWYAVIAHIVPFAVDYGIPDYKAFDLIVYIGIGSLFGCLTHGWFIDKDMIPSEFAKIGSLASLTVITFAFPAAHLSYPAMATLSCLYGIAAGVSLPLFFSLVRQLLPPQDVNAGVSLVILAEMLGDTTGGVCAGLIYDTTHDYEMSFFFAGSAIGLATFLQIILSTLKRRSNMKEQQSFKNSGFTDRVAVGNPVPNCFAMDRVI